MRWIWFNFGWVLSGIYIVVVLIDNWKGERERREVIYYITYYLLLLHPLFMTGGVTKIVRVLLLKKIVCFFVCCRLVCVFFCLFFCVFVSLFTKTRLSVTQLLQSIHYHK